MQLLNLVFNSALAKNLNRFSNDVVNNHNWNRNKFLNYDSKLYRIIGMEGSEKLYQNIRVFGMKVFVHEKNKKLINSSKSIKFVG